MALTIKPATSKDDEEVVSLFYDVEVPIESAYWTRSFSPQQPAAFVSTPYLAKDEENRVVAFVIARPRMLQMGNETISVQVLHNLIFHPTLIFQEGQHEFLQHLLSLKELTFVAGAGLELSRILDRERFLRAGNMSRYSYQTGSRPPQMMQQIELRKGLPSPAELEKLLQVPGQERRFYFERNEEWLRWMHEGPAASSREVLCGYDEEESRLLFLAASRTTPGLNGPEMQIIDALCPLNQVRTMGQALATKAHSRKMGLYISFFGTAWEGPLEAAGFQALRPRWPLLWMIRDPKQRSLINVLLRLDQWHFFPMDGEIDHT